MKTGVNVLSAHESECASKKSPEKSREKTDDVERQKGQGQTTSQGQKDIGKNMGWTALPSGRERKDERQNDKGDRVRRNVPDVMESKLGGSSENPTGGGESKGKAPPEHHARA